MENLENVNGAVALITSFPSMQGSSLKSSEIYKEAKSRVALFSEHVVQCICLQFFGFTVSVMKEFNSYMLQFSVIIYYCNT